MALDDLGEKKKEERKDKRAEDIGVDDVEEFDELKERVKTLSSIQTSHDKKIRELEDKLDSQTALIEGIFTLMRGKGDLVEVIVKEKEEDVSNKWRTGEK